MGPPDALKSTSDYVLSSLELDLSELGPFLKMTSLVVYMAPSILCLKSLISVLTMFYMDCIEGLTMTYCVAKATLFPDF